MARDAPRALIEAQVDAALGGSRFDVARDVQGGALHVTLYLHKGPDACVQVCYRCGIVVLQGYYRGITGILQGYYRGITGVLLGYYRGITGVLQGYTWELKRHYRDNTGITTGTTHDIT
jgi:hypothetical protein